MKRILSLGFAEHLDWTYSVFSAGNMSSGIRASFSMSNGFVEVDVFLVQRIPEVVVGGGDDLVKGGGAVVVAVQLQHGDEVVGRHRIVHGVFGDVAVGHRGFLHAGAR